MLEPERARKLNTILTIIGACLTQFALGIAFSFGNLIPYFASYFTYIEYEQSKYTLTTAQLSDFYSDQTTKTNWIFFILLVTFATGVYFGGNIELYHGPKRALAFSGTLMSFGFGLTFFAFKYGAFIGGGYALYLCAFTIGILWATGMGIGYPILMVVGMRWFPTRRGIVGGVCLSLFSTGAFIFDTIETLIVNPLNIPLNEQYGYVKQPQIIDRIPLMFIYVAMITTVMQFISFLCIKNPPWFNRTDNNTILHMQQQQMGRHSNKKNLSRVLHDMQMQMDYEQYSLTVRQAMHFSSFWILCIQTFLYNLISTVAILQWKVFAMNDLLILDDRYLSMVGSLSALGNGMGRIFWGMFYDYTGRSYRLTQGAMSLILTVFVVSWPLCSYAPLIMFPIWNFIIWFQVNCCFAIYPSVISSAFGAKYVGSFLGCMTFAEIFSTLFVVVIAPGIYTLFHGWTYYLFMIGAFGFCTVVLAGVYKPNVDRKHYCLKEDMSESKRLIFGNNSSNSSFGSYATFGANSFVGESLDLGTPY